jgi:hypothetical protein
MRLVKERASNCMNEITSNTPLRLNPLGSVPQFLNEKQTAGRLAVSVALLRKLRNRRQGPVFHRLGKRVVYAETDIIIWLNSCPSGGGGWLNIADKARSSIQ